MEKLRTEQQNKAMHLWFTQVADALNDAGLSMKEVLEPAKIDIEWTPVSVKESLWRPVQKKMFAKASTKDLNKHENITRIYDVLNRFLAQNFGIHVPFPSHEPGYADTAPQRDTI